MPSASRPRPLSRGRLARGEQQPVRVDPRAVFQRERQAFRRAFRLGGGRAEVDLGAGPAQGRGQDLPGEGGFPGQQRMLRFDQRHLRTERGVDLRQLTPGGPPAEHDEAPGQVGRAQALRGGPRRDVGQALDRRRDRLAAGRYDQVGIGQRHGRPVVAGQRHLDRARARDPAGAADHRHARAGHPARRGGIVQAAGHLVPAGHRVFPGLAAGRGKQQRVRRQAGQVRGLAADQARLDQGHRLAAAYDLRGDVQAGGPAAKHHYIESIHVSPSPSNFEPLPGHHLSRG